MSKCRWLKPRLVATIEFAEWTDVKEAASDYTRSSNKPQKFRITHPFHPLSGREFEALSRKEYGDEHRVCFVDKQGRQCEIPLGWTDLAAEDPFPILSSGKSWFRAVILVELACLIEGLRR